MPAPAALARPGWVKTAVGSSALCLALMGLAFLFAGVELTSAVFATPVAEPFPQILGAALLGFASMNWIARHNILGGIYGRAVVAANQTHLTVGAIVLVKFALTRGGSVALWVLAALYVAGALLFNALTMGRGLAEKTSSPGTSGQSPGDP